VLALAAGGAGAACSSSSAPVAGDAGSTGDDASGDDGPPACLATSTCAQMPTGMQECVTTVSATVVDPSGKPVPKLPVFVCGTNLCSVPQPTADDGTVTLSVCLPFASPAMKVFSDPQWGALAALLSGSGPSFAVGTVTVTPLPAMGAALGPGAMAKAGPVALSLDASATVKFDVEHTTADAQMFRSAEVPDGALPGSLAAQGIQAAWALAPLNTVIAPPASITVPNAKGWPAGTAVDFYLDGTDTAQPKPAAPWGQWGLLGTGAVSGDGMSITLTSQQGGLPEIAMVGVKMH